MLEQARFATRAIHVGQAPDETTGATVPPIHVTSTYTQAAPGQHKGYEYSRSQNPTRDGLQAVLAALEHGDEAASFASGLAASTALITALLRPGDSIVAYGDMYGGTYRLLERVFGPWGLVRRYTDESDPTAIAALCDETTRMVWIETPTNPMLRLLDIAAVAGAVRKRAETIGAGRDPGDGRPGGVQLVVDNTFATPALQQPLTLGADIVLHSTTKYLGGHSDVVGGAVITKTSATMEPIRFVQNAAGGVSGPFDCFLTHRGIKTLPVRMQAHCANAQRVAEWCEASGAFEKVVYPGLASHPDHELAKQQMAGNGGIVSIVLAGGFEAASRFMSALRVFSCAESLGGVESLANHPAIMTHASIPREVREARGVVDGLVRLSVGIEDPKDQVQDLEQALRAVGTVGVG